VKTIKRIQQRVRQMSTRIGRAMQLKWVGILLLFAGRLGIAAPVVNIAVDNPNLGLNDEVQVQISVTDGSPRGEPTVDNIGDFEVQSSGSSSQTTIMNGAVTRTTTFTYVLTPKKLGIFHLGPARVDVGGQHVVSNIVDIQVNKNGSPASPLARNDNREDPANVKSEATVDKKDPVVGEQILYTYRFYSKGPVAQARLGLPEFSGFLKEPVEKQQEYNKVIEGVEWHVSEVKYVLFATSAGPVTIEPATLQAEVEVQNTRQNSPLDSFFDDSMFGFGRMSTKRIRLRTDPILIQVQPLPGVGKPADFSGLVGKFKLSASLSKSTLAAGESTTLSIAVDGVGNVKDALLPAMTFPHFKVYDDQPTVAVSNENGRVSGKKTFKKALVPLTPGTETLPPITLSYFDTSSKSYQTLHSSAMVITVTPGTEAGLAHSIAQTSDLDKKDLKIQGEDLMPLKRSGQNASDSLSRSLQTGLLFLFTLFPLIFGGSFIYQRRLRKIQNDKGYQRRGKAFKKFSSDLKNTGQKQEFDRLSRLLRDYLGDKLNFDGLALTPLDSERVLKPFGLSTDRIRQVETFLKTCESSSYGGESFSAEKAGALRKELVALVGSLEREISA
jgi:hypothetical protein